MQPCPLHLHRIVMVGQLSNPRQFHKRTRETHRGVGVDVSRGPLYSASARVKIAVDVQQKKNYSCGRENFVSHTLLWPSKFDFIPPYTQKLFCSRYHDEPSSWSRVISVIILESRRVHIAQWITELLSSTYVVIASTVRRVLKTPVLFHESARVERTEHKYEGFEGSRVVCLRR